MDGGGGLELSSAWISGVSIRDLDLSSMLGSTGWSNNGVAMSLDSRVCVHFCDTIDEVYFIDLPTNPFQNSERVIP